MANIGTIEQVPRRAGWRRPFLWGIALSLLHFILLIGLLTLLIGSSMNRFDAGTPPNTVEEAGDLIVTILMLPLSMAWTDWMSQHVPDVFEWLLLGMNSAIWGFGAAAALILFPKACRRVPRLAQ